MRSGRFAEVGSLAQFDALLADEARSLRGWRIQDVDLRERSDVLASLAVGGALFLGCAFEAGVEASLRARGALVFPEIPDVPFDQYRSSLYTAEELYADLADGYVATPDARIYAWSRQIQRGASATFATALHDHAVDDALARYVDDRHVAGVMGGHGMLRSSERYADAARLGRALARAGLGVATGGGPGAMEAANLGAHMASHPDAELDAAVATLGDAPDFATDVDDWAQLALRVRAKWPADPAVLNLGIPTWHYGHEPPNPFPAAIAKYFRNAIREDTLLRACSAGIVFLPGTAGTVQEVFDDAGENYYAVPGQVAPMVLLDRAYWTEDYPVWPLLQRVARGREMESTVHLADSVDEAVSILSG